MSGEQGGTHGVQRGPMEPTLRCAAKTTGSDDLHILERLQQNRLIVQLAKLLDRHRMRGNGANERWKLPLGIRVAGMGHIPTATECWTTKLASSLDQHWGSR